MQETINLKDGSDNSDEIINSNKLFDKIISKKDFNYKLLNIIGLLINILLIIILLYYLTCQGNIGVY